LKKGKKKRDGEGRKKRKELEVTNNISGPLRDKLIIALEGSSEGT